MREELMEQNSLPHGKLFYQFFNQKRIQFMGMSIYVIPINDIREIVKRDFPALVEIFTKDCARLDTKNIRGDDTVVCRDEETDRFMDCWRKVARLFSVHRR